MHLLPVYPSSGDGGFAPLRYDQVDPHFGDWSDVEAIAKDYALMLECMVNHISPASDQFQDFLEKGDASEHADMFIDWEKFWGEGVLRHQISCVSLLQSLPCILCMSTFHVLFKAETDRDPQYPQICCHHLMNDKAASLNCAQCA